MGRRPTNIPIKATIMIESIAFLGAVIGAIAGANEQHQANRRADADRRHAAQQADADRAQATQHASGDWRMEQDNIYDDGRTPNIIANQNARLEGLYGEGGFFQELNPWEAHGGGAAQGTAIAPGQSAQAGAAASASRASSTQAEQHTRAQASQQQTQAGLHQASLMANTTQQAINTRAQIVQTGIRNKISRPAIEDAMKLAEFGIGADSNKGKQSFDQYADQGRRQRSIEISKTFAESQRTWTQDEQLKIINKINEVNLDYKEMQIITGMIESGSNSISNIIGSITKFGSLNNKKYSRDKLKYDKEHLKYQKEVEKKYDDTGKRLYAEIGK